MALDTFTWAVDVGTALEPEIALKTAKFGNGFEQTVGDGLNIVKEVWAISIFGDISVVGDAYDFLVTHVGKAFLWTTPRGRTIKVRGTDMKLPSNGASTYTLSAKFTQAFTPD